MITLDGIELNPNMVWTERFHSGGIAMSMRRTLGGVPMFSTGDLVAGDPITLEATENYGWLQKSVVDQLMALAGVADASYILVYNGESIRVRFRHYDAPAIEMTPFVPREAHAETDYMFGQIKLVTS